MPLAGARAVMFAAPLTQAMNEFLIKTPRTQAAFLGQVAHETASLRYMAEIADGSDYEGRADLGNVNPGDGVRFKGRGLLQTTGRANYERCGKALGLDLIRFPELLERPEYACRAGAWFWFSNGLNALAEADRFGAVTKRINGGYNGLDERISHWLRIRRALGL